MPKKNDLKEMSIQELLDQRKSWIIENWEFAQGLFRAVKHRGESRVGQYVKRSYLHLRMGDIHISGWTYTDRWEISKGEWRMIDALIVSVGGNWMDDPNADVVVSLFWPNHGDPDYLTNLFVPGEWMKEAQAISILGHEIAAEIGKAEIKNERDELLEALLSGKDV